MDFPANDPLLARLQLMQRRGGVPVAAGGASDWYEVMLFPGAADAKILAVQERLGQRLPNDFIRFWRFSNGANLFVNDSGLHGVGVASTDLLLELQEEEREIYGAEAMAPYIVFARVNGAGDFLVFDQKTGRVLDGVHAEKPHEWRPIAASFTHWLEMFLDEGGRYFWIEALYESARSDA